MKRLKLNRETMRNLSTNTLTAVRGAAHPISGNDPDCQLTWDQDCKPTSALSPA